MKDILDLERYPIDRPASDAYAQLVATCQRDLERNGMFNLDGFVQLAAIARAAAQVQPLARTVSFTHQRDHNVYFQEQVAGLAQDHGALKRFHTAHHTLCDDQLIGTVIHEIYEYAPLATFLAAAMGVPALYHMQDPLARANVMEYRAGETLNWHFDRSVYTTTLLIQAAEEGGEFEYRSGLRTDTDPNYEGVAKLLAGSDPAIRVNPLAAGTLNVFKGKNTLHRVSTVRGSRSRLVAVLSYYDRPGVTFSETERMGFYGRAS